MNRVDSPEFPNTIYSVIFDRKYGVQFTPVANGSIYNSANAECERAAKMVLEGTSVDNEVLYFMNAAAAEQSVGEEQQGIPLLDRKSQLLQVSI